MFWLFKKKDDHKLKKEVETIQGNLKSSFKHIKNDMTEVNDWLNSLHSKYNFHADRLTRIEAQLEILLDSKQKHSKRFNEPQVQTMLLKNLTDTQKKIYLTIHQLQKQLGNKTISYKSIAQVYYPDKDYNSIRSTLSEYITSLYEIGLIEIKKTSNQSKVKLTERGISLINEIDLEEEGWQR